MTRTEHWEIESRNAGDVEMSEDEDGGCRMVLKTFGGYVMRWTGKGEAYVGVSPAIELFYDGPELALCYQDPNETTAATSVPT